MSAKAIDYAMRSDVDIDALPCKKRNIIHY
jgi:hypothetical protein